MIVIDVDKEIIAHGYPIPSEVMLDGSLSLYLWMENRLSCIAYKDFAQTYKIFILFWFRKGVSLSWDGTFGLCCCLWSRASRFICHFSFVDKRSNYLSSSFKSKPNWNIPKSIHFGYNVKTRKLTKIKGIPEGNFGAWLHTNNMVSLPCTLA